MYRSAFICLLIVIGCAKESNTISGVGERQPSFVIDTMRFSAIFKPDSNFWSPTQWTHVYFEIVYHFEGQQGQLGALDDLRVSTNDTQGNYYEDNDEQTNPIISNVGVQRTIAGEFVGGGEPGGRDSLLLHLIFEGQFFALEDSTMTGVGSFLREDSAMVWIQR